MFLDTFSSYFKIPVFGFLISKSVIDGFFFLSKKAF